MNQNEKTETLKVKLDNGAFVPVRAHEDDAGLDLISPVDVNIWTKGREAICTGVHVQIPKGYVGMITAKSGLMRDHGIITTGTIDAGYTGPVNVVLFNTGDKIFRVKRGMKIAQLVIKQIITPKIEVVDELEETERGDGGFGSTGSMARSDGRFGLKNGKKPTVRQRKIIRYFGKIPENWLVVKHTPEEMVIVHKISGQILTMQRGGMDRGAW